LNSVEIDNVNVNVHNNVKVSLISICKSSEELENLGSKLGNYLSNGDVLFLKGDVGAGKTTLSRGIIRAKFDDREMTVTSPTYLLDNYYEVDEVEKIHHMDFYRLKDSCDFEILGIPNIFDTSICLIEWPERLGSNFPNSYLEVDITIDEKSERREVVFKPFGDHWYEKIKLFLLIPGVAKNSEIM
jgi:tRNA threonylcarbamoyladenosine biosynthesis protein TsaE